MEKRQFNMRLAEDMIKRCEAMVDGVRFRSVVQVIEVFITEGLAREADREARTMASMGGAFLPGAKWSDENGTYEMGKDGLWHPLKKKGGKK